MIQLIFLQATDGLMNMVPFVLMIGVLYFFMIRPQMVRQKKEKKFQSEIKKGTSVIMTSGIHGKILEVNDNNNTVLIETGAGKIRFERSSISMELSRKLSEKKEDKKK